jgi:broad specificity phosphatase PhoE
VGHAQAKRLAGRLAGVPVDRVWSSHLRRARETAEFVAAVHGLEVLSDPRLREVRTHWDESTPADQLVRGSYPFPEPEEEVVARMREAIGDVVAGLGPPVERRRRAVVVTHSAAILLYVGHVLRLGWNGLRVFPQFTSISVVVVRGDRTVVQSVGDVTHLANLDGSD